MRWLPEWMRIGRAPAIVLGMLMLLSGCGSLQNVTHGGGLRGITRDGAPSAADIPDLDRIPDAVPRFEPRSRYGNPASYQVGGRTYYVLDSALGYTEQGVASWYGTKFHGARTSSGDPYDMFKMTAAHKTLPIPCYARITNLQNGRSIVVRINDRGPFEQDRLVDLSYVAAYKLGILATGTGLVRLETIGPADLPNPATRLAVASARQTRLFLQAGAYADPDRAAQIKAQLMAAGFEPVFLQESQINERRLYRVRVGPLPSVDEADQLGLRLRQLGLGDGRVIVE